MDARNTRKMYLLLILIILYKNAHIYEMVYLISLTIQRNNTWMESLIQGYIFRYKILCLRVLVVRLHVVEI